MKGMRDKNGTGDKDVSGDVLRSFVENGLRLMTTDQNHTRNRRVAQGFH